MLAEINKNTTTFIRELNGKMNWTVSCLPGILYLQVFSLNLRTYSVRIFNINLLSSAGWKKTAQIKVVSRLKKIVLAKPPPFPQHSSINLDVVLKTRGKLLNFIKNVFQLFHGMYIIYKLKGNINCIFI